MNQDKLDKAAQNALCSRSFRDGAQWLMSQPLDEKLTREEKRKITALLDYIEALGGGAAACVNNIVKHLTTH